MILDRFSVLMSSRFIPYSRHFLNEFIWIKGAVSVISLDPPWKDQPRKVVISLTFLIVSYWGFQQTKTFAKFRIFSQKWIKQKYAKTIQNFMKKKLNETLAATKNCSKHLWNSLFWEVSIRSFIVQWVPVIWVNYKSFL